MGSRVISLSRGAEMGITQTSVYIIKLHSHFVSLWWHLIYTWWYPEQQSGSIKPCLAECNICLNFFYFCEIFMNFNTHRAPTFILLHVFVIYNCYVLRLARETKANISQLGIPSDGLFKNNCMVLCKSVINGLIK